MGNKAITYFDHSGDDFNKAIDAINNTQLIKENKLIITPIKHDNDHKAVKEVISIYR